MSKLVDMENNLFMVGILSQDFVTRGRYAIGMVVSDLLSSGMCLRLVSMDTKVSYCWIIFSREICNVPKLFSWSTYFYNGNNTIYL